MKLILKYIRKHLGIFLLSTFFLTMEAMADLLQPAFMSAIVDQGIKNADVKRILFFGMCMLRRHAQPLCQPRLSDHWQAAAP